MGIGLQDLGIFIKLKEDGYLPEHSSVMEIGAQQLANTFLSSKVEIEKMGRLCNISSTAPLPPPLPSKIVQGALEHQEAATPPARDFWEWLGFTYASIDIDGSPGSIPLDLNYDEAPEQEWKKYQLVTNFGTTEHIANQLNAFKVIHDLTAVGGIMMHNLPAQGMFNHGLVNYNLKFFWMLSRSNGYKWLHADYSSVMDYYELPQNIVEHVALFNPHISSRAKEFKATDCSIHVVMQKTFDTPYVPPLDVGTGTKTDSEILKKRYWSVFNENAFETFQQNAEANTDKTTNISLMQKIRNFFSVH